MNSEKNGAITSVSNRLLPMPGGPSMTSKPPRPCATAVTSAPITFSSSRPPANRRSDLQIGVAGGQPRRAASWAGCTVAQAFADQGACARTHPTDPLSVIGRYGKVGGVGELTGSQHTSAARRTAGPPVRPLSTDQQPATKADLYAAVDAMRADMRQLLDQISSLVREATQGVESRVSDLERANREAGLDTEW